MELNKSFPEISRGRIGKWSIIPLVVLFLSFGVNEGFALSNIKEGLMTDMEIQLDSLPALPTILKSDRILILAPHPDDETLGNAGLIQEALSAGASVRIAYLTNGDHDQITFKIDTHHIFLSPKTYIAMGEKRRQESIRATQILGLKKDDLYFLGYPDSGTLEIWENHWQDAPDFLNRLTGAKAVPYEDNFSFRAPYKGENILEDLKKILKEYQPTMAFVTAPADTNVDHQAAYCFLTAASLSLDPEISSPKTFLFLIHQGAWPRPYYFHPELPLLPPKNLQNSDFKWFKLLLKPEEVQKKYRNILQFKSAILRVRYYLWTAFARRNELFATLPSLDLKKSIPGSAADWETAMRLYGRGISEMEGQSELQTNLSGVSYLKTADGKLLVKASLNRILPVKTGISLYLFGFRTDVPFGKMPKLRVTVMPLSKITVRNGLQVIVSSGIKLSGAGRDLLFEVPLSDLGNPEKIFTSLRVHREELSLDATAWHLLDVK